MCARLLPTDPMTPAAGSSDASTAGHGGGTAGRCGGARYGRGWARQPGGGWSSRTGTHPYRVARRAQHGVGARRQDHRGRRSCGGLQTLHQLDGPGDSASPCCRRSRRWCASAECQLLGAPKPQGWAGGMPTIMLAARQMRAPYIGAPALPTAEAHHCPFARGRFTPRTVCQMPV